MAGRLARNLGYAVFPCRADKSPACPHGFKDASADPGVIGRLWSSWPGPLIGIACGAVSGVSVLDIDSARHWPAYHWWRRHWNLLLPTRVYATPSGGVHLYYRHATSERMHGSGSVFVANSGGKICPGVDTRGDGGYVVAWWAHGAACLDSSPVAAWPGFVLDALYAEPAALSPDGTALASGWRSEAARAAVEAAGELGGAKWADAVQRVLAGAREGERNACLFWCACRLGEAGWNENAIVGALGPIARDVGLTDGREVLATIRSALRQPGRGSGRGGER